MWLRIANVLNFIIMHIYNTNTPFDFEMMVSFL